LSLWPRLGSSSLETRRRQGRRCPGHSGAMAERFSCLGCEAVGENGPNHWARQNCTARQWLACGPKPAQWLDSFFVDFASSFNFQNFSNLKNL
jgi:hypothetical protein